MQERAEQLASSIYIQGYVPTHAWERGKQPAVTLRDATGAGFRRELTPAEALTLAGVIITEALFAAPALALAKQRVERERDEYRAAAEAAKALLAQANTAFEGERAEVARLRAELGAISETVGDKCDDLEAIHALVAPGNHQGTALDAVRARFADLAKQRDDAYAHATAQNGELDTTRARAAKAEADLARIVEHIIRQLPTYYHDDGTPVADLDEVIEFAGAEIREARVERCEADASLEKAERDVVAATARLAIVEAERNHLEGRLTYVRNCRDRATAQVSSLTADRNRLAADLELTCADAEALGDRLEKANNTRGLANAQVEMMERQVSDLDRERDAAIARAEKVEAEAAEARTNARNWFGCFEEQLALAHAATAEIAGALAGLADRLAVTPPTLAAAVDAVREAWDADRAAGARAAAEAAELRKRQVVTRAHVDAALVAVRLRAVDRYGRVVPFERLCAEFHGAVLDDFMRALGTVTLPAPAPALAEFPAVSDEELGKVYEDGLVACPCDGDDEGNPVVCCERAGLRAVADKVARSMREHLSAATQQVGACDVTAERLVAVSDDELALAFFAAREPTELFDLTDIDAADLAGIRAVRAKLGAAEVTEERLREAIREERHVSSFVAEDTAKGVLARLRATAAKGG